MKSCTKTSDCEAPSDATSLGIKDGMAVPGEGDPAPLHPCSTASVPATPCTPMPQALHGSTEVLNFSMMT